MTNGQRKEFLWKLKETVKVLFSLELLDEVIHEEEQKDSDWWNATRQGYHGNSQEQES